MAISPAAISLIVIAVVFLLIALCVVFFACWYLRRKQQEKKKNNAFFVPKSLDEPLVYSVKLQNGFPHTNFEGYKTATKGHMSNGYNIDHTKTVASQTYNAHTKTGGRQGRSSNPIFPPKRRGRDMVDHVRSFGHIGRHNSGNTRSPLYVHHPKTRGQHGSRAPVYVVTRSGMHEERGTITHNHGHARGPHSAHHLQHAQARARKVDKNWNLKPNPQQLHRQQQQHLLQQQQYHQLRLKTIDQYRPADIDLPPDRPLEHRVMDRSTEGLSVDDADGKALYLRWSPSIAKRKREAQRSRGDSYRHESQGGRDYWGDAACPDADRPASVGSFKIATNTLPMTRNNKTALPSPIPVGNKHLHKTQL